MEKKQTNNILMNNFSLQGRRLLLKLVQTTKCLLVTIFKSTHKRDLEI